MDKKTVNLEAEKAKVMREREELIRKFQYDYIYDEQGNLKKNIKVKNYVDGSKYEGEGITTKIISIK